MTRFRSGRPRIPQRIVDRIRIMHSAGFAIQEISDKLGVSPPTVRRYLRDKRLAGGPDRFLRDDRERYG